MHDVRLKTVLVLERVLADLAKELRSLSALIANMPHKRRLAGVYVLTLGTLELC